MDCLRIFVISAISLSLSACVVVPFPHASADANQVSGRLLDGTSRRPVSDATVVLVGLPATETRSDTSGRFVTRPSRSLHLVGIYTYDGLKTQFPPPKSGSDSLRIVHPAYKTRDIAVNTRRAYEPFSPRPAAIRLGDIYVERNR